MNNLCALSLPSQITLQVSYAAKSAKVFKGKSPKATKMFKGKSAKEFTKSSKGSDIEGHEGTADAKAGKVGSTSGDSKAGKIGTTADDAKAKKVGKSSGGDGAELTPHSVLGISASFESIDDMVGTIDAKAKKVGKSSGGKADKAFSIDAKAKKVGKSSGGGGGKTDKGHTSKTPKINADTILWRPGNLSY